MLKLYGIIGLLLVIFSEINFFLKIEPFDKFYFPIIWFGYILFIDSLAYKTRGKSLINNALPKLIGMFIISAPFWKIFEFINIRGKNWYYIGTEFFGPYADLFAFIAFSTVVPAFFVTLSFFITDISIKNIIPKDKISKKVILFSIIIGLLSFIFLLLFPKYFFPFKWIFLFLILDPINYYNKRPSLFYAIKRREKIILSIVMVSLILGFLWEFWNFYASVKWLYTIPFVEFWYFFEMPLLGYLGYIPFGFTTFSFYYFIEFLFKRA